MNVVSLLKKCALLCIGIWIILATIRTGINVSKIYTEERFWLGLSDQQKREKIFGDVYEFIQFIDKHTTSSNATLVLYTPSNIHWHVKYFLYPKKFFVVDNENELKEKLSTYSSVAINITKPLDTSLQTALEKGHFVQEDQKKNYYFFKKI